MDIQKLQEYEGLFLDPETGEAVVRFLPPPVGAEGAEDEAQVARIVRNAMRQDAVFFQTGFFFETIVVTHDQWKPGLNGPWAYATAETAERMKKFTGEALGLPVQLESVWDAAVYRKLAPQRQILITLPDGSTRIENAGLIASAIARTAALEEQTGVVTMNPALVAMRLRGE